MKTIVGRSGTYWDANLPGAQRMLEERLDVLVGTMVLAAGFVADCRRQARRRAVLAQLELGCRPARRLGRVLSVPPTNLLAGQKAGAEKRIRGSLEEAE